MRTIIPLITLTAILLSSGNIKGDEIRRIALVVGHNEGNDKDVELKYAERDASQISNVLTDLGGFDRVDLIHSPSAKQLSANLVSTRKLIQGWKQNGNEVFFLFYYSGHADESSLRLGGTSLDSDTLLNRISKIGADLRIAIIDACQSGSMVRQKGLIAQKPINVKLLDRLDVTGQAVLASTSQGENAQESDSLKGSFFSSHLVVALRGAADKNGDGGVSLTEAYHYAFDQTVQGTVVSAAGLQHPTYDMKLQGKRDVVLTWPDRSSAMLGFKASSIGRFIVVAGNGDHVVAEVEASAQRLTRIGLPSGTYSVKKRSPGGLLSASVDLSKGGSHILDESSMTLTPYVGVADKGPSLIGEITTPTRKTPWAWTSAAFAAAALGTGVTMEILAAVENANLTDKLEKKDTSWDDIRAMEETRDARALTGHIALGVCAALTAAAIALFVFEDDESPRPASKTPVFSAGIAGSPTERGLFLKGSF